MGIYAMTGGATGIGAAIKQNLRNDGHRVIVVDIKGADIVADLSSSEGRRAAIQGIVDAAPDGLDGFVACAGVGANVPNPTLITNVNYYGTTELVAGLKERVAAKAGAMVLISSNSAPHPTNDEFVDLLVSGERDKALAVAETIEPQQAYSGSKRALARWIRRNTADFAASGVRLKVRQSILAIRQLLSVRTIPVLPSPTSACRLSCHCSCPGCPRETSMSMCAMLPKCIGVCWKLILLPVVIHLGGTTYPGASWGHCWRT